MPVHLLFSGICFIARDSTLPTFRPTIALKTFLLDYRPERVRALLVGEGGDEGNYAVLDQIEGQDRKEHHGQVVLDQGVHLGAHGDDSLGGKAVELSIEGEHDEGVHEDVKDAGEDGRADEAL